MLNSMNVILNTARIYALAGSNHMKRLKRIIQILVLITVAVCMSSCQKSSSVLYEEKEKIAEVLMLQHKYIEAAEEMEELGDYEKAVKFAGYCRGLDAGEKGEFDNAAKFFQPLGEYRDSGKMFVYYTARACESKATEIGSDQIEQYLIAAETYKEAGSFRDSKERNSDFRHDADCQLNRKFKKCDRYSARWNSHSSERDER